MKVKLKDVAGNEQADVLWTEIEVGECFISLSSGGGVCLKVSDSSYYSFAGGRLQAWHPWPCRRLIAQLNYKVKR